MNFQLSVLSFETYLNNQQIFIREFTKGQALPDGEDTVVSRTDIITLLKLTVQAGRQLRKYLHQYVITIFKKYYKEKVRCVHSMYYSDPGFLSSVK